MTPFARFPFLRYVLCLIAGILLAPYFAEQLIGLLLSCLILMLLYIVLYHSKVSKSLIGATGMLILIILGSITVELKREILLKNHYSIYSNPKSVLDIEVVEMVEEKESTWKVIAQINRIVKNDSLITCDGKVLLYVDKKNGKKPELGEKYWLANHLKRIEDPKNPNEFDFKRYMELQDIFDQQYVRHQDWVYAGKTKQKSIYYYAMLLNRKADSIVVRALPQKSVHGVVNAMVLGVRDELDSPLMQSYSAAGAIHVLSVSGMHVGIIYQVLVILLGFLKKRKNRWSQGIFVLTVLVLLWFYAFLTGLSSPVLRSTLMFSMLLIAEVIHKKQNTYNTVALSAFVLLLLNPAYLYQVGFQLSYLAVLGMLFFQPLLVKLWITDVHKSWYIRILYWFWELTCVSIAAQLATFPLTVYYFHQFPLYFLIANPFMIFFSTLVLCAGLLFIVIYPVIQLIRIKFIIPILANIVGGLTNALNFSAEMTEQLPHSMLHFLHLSKVEVVVLYAMLITFGALWITKDFVWIKIGAICLSFLLIYQFKGIVFQKEQKQMVIHSVPRGHVISIIDGTQALILGDSSFLKNKKEIGFRLTNYLSVRGIKDSISRNPFKETGVCVLKYKHYKLLYIPNAIKNKKLESSLHFDWVILGNKAIKRLEDLNNLKYKGLILDGSCSEYYSALILKQSEALGIKAMYLRQSGAKVLF